MRNYLNLVLLLGSCGLAGCAATAPVTPEAAQQAERRLLQPFLGGAEVQCNELVIEITGNFNANVTQPAHQVELTAGDGFIERVWTNTLGQRDKAFTIIVGLPAELTATGLKRGPSTIFKVQHRVRVKVWQARHALTLNAWARGIDGSPIAIREASMPKARTVHEFVVIDGKRQAP